MYIYLTGEQNTGTLVLNNMTNGEINNETKSDQGNKQ